MRARTSPGGRTKREPARGRQGVRELRSFWFGYCRTRRCVHIDHRPPGNMDVVRLRHPESRPRAPCTTMASSWRQPREDVARRCGIWAPNSPLHPNATASDMAWLPRLANTHRTTPRRARCCLPKVYTWRRSPLFLGRAGPIQHEIITIVMIKRKRLLGPSHGLTTEACFSAFLHASGRRLALSAGPSH
ncbi:hypothetical protein VTK73DRAFT_8925 [Phialemonium thermophilum]|uniref:Uncharacterized protein n=1 Tax=Phialemonium thermophilum TaxID=223376 RepID=A0ABR3W5L7_9PEZI